MTVPWNQVAKLEPEHDIDAFSSGFAPVDDWLHGNARPNQHLVATHVCLDDRGVVRGFFALRTVVISTEGMSSAQRKGSKDGLSAGILLCWMGLRSSDRGQQIGPALLREAMAQAARAHAISPVQLFVVDAANEELIGYYEAAGLQRIPNTLRLVAPMGSIIKFLAR